MSQISPDSQQANKRFLHIEEDFAFGGSSFYSSGFFEITEELPNGDLKIAMFGSEFAFPAEFVEKYCSVKDNTPEDLHHGWATRETRRLKDRIGFKMYRGTFLGQRSSLAVLGKKPVNLCAIQVVEVLSRPSTNELALPGEEVLFAVASLHPEESFSIGVEVVITIDASGQLLKPVQLAPQRKA
jgi:hypothetical protein